MVTRVDEADDRDASPGVAFQMLQQLASVSPGTDENDPALRAFQSRRSVLGFRGVQGIDHELPPIRRSIIPALRPTRTFTGGRLGTLIHGDAFLGVRALPCFSSIFPSALPTDYSRNFM